MDTLRTFIVPMLPKLGQAFDSDKFLCEVKWDGTRTLAFTGHGTYRLVNRRRQSGSCFNRRSRSSFGSRFEGEHILSDSCSAMLTSSSFSPRASSARASHSLA
jgi:hypothetical protein